MFAVMMELRSDESWKADLDLDIDTTTWGFAGPFESREIAEEAVGAAISNGCPNAFLVSAATKFDRALGEGYDRALRIAKSLIA